MPRRDQYGTHDELGRGPRGGRIARNAREDIRNGRTHAPNYGSAQEKRVRSSGGSGAQYQGRDYERENYGGGYGVRHETRDVPRAGRQLPGDRTQGWRGQIGGTGMDGLASERAFGTENNEQMSRSDNDRAYLRWREVELRGHDDDYRAWRRAQELRLDEDYARWKASQRDRKRF